MSEENIMTIIFLSIIYVISIGVIYMFSHLYYSNEVEGISKWKIELYSIILAFLSPITILAFFVFFALDYCKQKR